MGANRMKRVALQRAPTVRVGCAGWSISSANSAQFPGEGSHLERYAGMFNCVEINSSFYRPHMPKTYRRWADSVPDEFRFSVKIPRSISHEQRLVDCESDVAAFLLQVCRLEQKLGCLLLQLPPSLPFERIRAITFFRQLRRATKLPVVYEPRHVSWFTPEASSALRELDISRAAADPAVVPQAMLPAGSSSLQYLRLHGSPRMYYDAYSDETLKNVAKDLSQTSSSVSQHWCIFDNTALGHATSNALALIDILRGAG
ncbi:MAG: DUF72 domain-containing protein [Dokdonella sp.]